MRADNSHHVIQAARLRAQQTRQRAVTALRRMDAAGQHITFDAVSREAGVSRSWLYAQEDLRTEIERLRQRHSATSSAQVPPQRQRASDTSLLRRLEAATARIRQLETDNQQLRDALARTLGERRAADVLGGDRQTRHAEPQHVETHRTLLSRPQPRPVNDTVHIASQQVTAMIKNRAKDNGRRSTSAGPRHRRRCGWPG